MACALFSFLHYFSAPLLFFSVVLFWNVSWNFFSPCLAEPLDFKTTGLIIVRVQNDFMEGGVLPVPGANSIIPVINNLMKNHLFGQVFRALSWKDRLAINFNTNYFDQAPFTDRYVKVGSRYTRQYLLPDHCIEGEEGARSPPDLFIDRDRYPDWRTIKMEREKHDYSKSCFIVRDSEGLMHQNTQHYYAYHLGGGHSIETVVVVGIDVQETALDAILEEDFNVIVISDACVYSDNKTAANAMLEMQLNNVKFINSTELSHFTFPDKETEEDEKMEETEEDEKMEETEEDEEVEEMEEDEEVEEITLKPGEISLKGEDILEKVEKITEKVEKITEKVEEISEIIKETSGEKEETSGEKEETSGEKEEIEEEEEEIEELNPDTAALLIVRVQNDFMKDGAFEIQGADSIIPSINSLLEKYAFKQILVAKAWHPINHISFNANYEGGEVFTEVDVLVAERNRRIPYYNSEPTRKQYLAPVHCIQHTNGADLPSNLRIKEPYKTIYMGEQKDDYLEVPFLRKNFESKYVADLDSLNELKSLGIKTIVIVGIDVQFIAYIASLALFEPIVILDASRFITSKGVITWLLLRKEHNLRMTFSKYLSHGTSPDEKKKLADFPLYTIPEKEEESAEKGEESFVLVDASAKKEEASAEKEEESAEKEEESAEKEEESAKKEEESAEEGEESYVFVDTPAEKEEESAKKEEESADVPSCVIA